MECQVLKIDNTSAGSCELSEAVFDQPYNEPLIHQVVNAYFAKARQGTKAQKNRSDVRGGGAKPWRQKGTGRARAGTRSSPIWRGGGATFAARPRNHEQKVNRKMYRGAMKSIFSELMRTDRLCVLDELSLDTPKTKALLKPLNQLLLSDVLIVTAEVTENLYLAARNLPWVDVRDTIEIDPVSLIAYDKILMTCEALKKVEEQLS